MANMSTQPFDAYDHTVLDYEGDQNAATPMVESSAVTILPTTTVEVTKPVLTDSDIVGNTEPALHTSYSDIVTKSSQFPMQHATDGLPSNNVTIETTDYQKDILDLSISLPKLELTTSESPESSNTSVPSSQTSSEATDSPPQSSSLSSSIKLPVGSSAKGTTNKIPDLYTSYEPSVSESNSATGFLSSSITNNMQITSISAVLNDSKNVLDSSKDIHIAVSKSVDYVPSTGDLYSPVTASKTVFVAGNSMDASFKSTSAIPLSPSGKPVNTVDPGGTALFGGELTDYILYIGVPVCGLVILVFLIVCVVCLRKRKNKHKGSPTKNHVQDLWVNSQQELPLTTRDPLREVNGGDTIGGHRDLGCTTYEVVFDFQAELETHLTLKQGDVVQVHRKEGNGWWRGTIGENSGWFPSNYVQAAPQDKLETEDEIEMHSESNVSSFMVQARHTPRQTPIHTPSLRDSLPSEKDIEAEPIYCKIQPKEKRKSFPKVSDKSPSKLAAENTENATTPIEDGSKYMAIYSYGGHFTGELTINKGDIIQGRELDKNGWMKGYNESTNIEGWCPLQYVNRLDKEEISQLDPMVIPNSDSQTSLSPDPLTYKQLEANKGVDKDWVGIIHKAVHTFSGDKAGDLEFEVGDLITVFQVLENGWWLGSKGKVVGWFPGAYVEMIPQPSPRLPRNRSAPSPSNSSQTSDSPVSSDETKSITDWSNDASPLKPKPRPVRKAPPPPIRLDGSSEAKSANPKSPNSVDASESRIPTPTQNKAPQVPRPVKVSPPAPPIRDHSPDPSPLYEAIGKGRTDHISEPVLIQTTINDGVYDLIQHPSIDTENQLKNKIKPDVPRRYIKPKLVKIPRSEINIPSIGPPNGIPGSANIARPRAPPPPRPTEPPKYPRENLQEVREFAKQENEITNNESFFHLPPQNNLGEIPTKDSSDMNMDMDFIYQGMSSFGSTFGKKEENFSNNDAFVRKEETPYDNEDYVTQKSFQSKVKDIEKALGVPSDSTLDKGLDKFNLKEEFVQDNELRGAEECEGALRNTMQQTTMDKPAQKKQQSLSKIQPPKHISLSNSEDKKAIPNVSATEIVQEERQTPKISRIPMSANVSIKDTSVQNIEHRLDKASDRLEGQVEVNDSAVIEHTDITPKELNHDVHNESYNQNSENETSRSRSESFNKPPVAPKPKSKSTPKCLPKQSPDSKYPEGSHDITDNVITNHDIESNSIENTCAEGEPTNKESQKVSKLPKIAQKSPKSKKSGIPASPLMRMKNAEKQSKNVNKQKLSESDSDVPLSPTSTKMNKPESPAMARRGAAKQIVNNEKSIRNRSNSPHARTGIPTSLKQRSNSPSSKLPRMANTPSPGSPSPTSIPQLNNKASGLAPPKKIQTPKQQHSPRNDHVSPESLNQSPDTSFDMTDDDTDQSTTSPKPDRPSKPPRVVKQKSQDVKTSKHGRSLLPVIHKTLDGTNGVTPPTKHKTGIPVSKLPKAASSKAAPEESNNRGPTLFQAVRGYTAQTEEELSFTEGTFVTELSDCDRVGWYVGMLADGSTGLYPAECFKPSPLYNESEA